MNDDEYATWWPLHLRIARGETLSAEEQAAYDALRRVWDDREFQQLTERWAIQARVAAQEITESEVEIERLRERRAALTKRIAELERQLDEPTRRLLGTAPALVG